VGLDTLVKVAASNAAVIRTEFIYISGYGRNTCKLIQQVKAKGLILWSSTHCAKL